MSNNIVLKRGLDIPIKGAAARETVKTVKPDVIALKPSDFKCLVPRLLVREGDKVLAGSPVMADKNCPDILFTSPVSGTVAEIVRGEKRKLLEVRIKADAEQEFVDFGVQNVAKMSAEDVKDLLLKSGLWASFIQRPYGILADPQVKPKAIFVSAYATAPLAAELDYVLADEIANVQTGVNAVAKLTEGGVHLSIGAAKASADPFHKIENVIMHTVSGKHPAGNVGVQISNIDPIQKGETVWTITPLLLAAIGKLINTGKVNLARKVAVTGPAAVNPAYVEAVPGISMKEIAQFCAQTENVRIISGDVLTGKTIGPEGFLGFYDNQVTILREGYEKELLGWANPLRLNQFSSTRSYFSWLCPKKQYDMDTNLHGGPRAFLMSDSYYKEVLPMDIYPLYLVKACLAGEIEKMEQFGIYEVLPEDLALCEYTDPSKNYIQDIIAKGIDLMLKEMA